MRIGRREIGSGQRPFIIAEMSANHGQSLDHALRIVEAAAWAGVDAIKLQTYTADTMTIDCDAPDFLITDPKSLWHGQTLYGLYQRAYTPWEWHEPIFRKARQLGLEAFSSPFDEQAVDFLEGLDVPAYKIASFENNHLLLIRKAAATGKPMILSTGVASLADLEEAVSTARQAGCRDLVLLRCSSAYPADPADIHLATIPHLRDLFQVEVGLSDHTLGVGVAVAAAVLGATVIEKHFTLSRADGGPDAAFSMEPSEMKQLVQETTRASQAVGRVNYALSDREQASSAFRRSIYAVRDIPAGTSLTRENIGVIRPGHGLAPKYFERILGRRSREPIPRGTPLRWEVIQ